VLDLIGYNYAHKKYPEFPETYPGKNFIATETTSALATRGSYDMPSDSIRIWPESWDKDFDKGNPDNTCSSYDNCHVPWGSTHEETWKVIKKHDFVSGIFIWTGFDYLGEPTPYSWPSRSSYFGIVDLAGFPKDAYYLYKSEWTDKPVLHIFPHWNWGEGDTIDVWAYTNCEEVELFLNDKSLGIKKKSGDDLHLMWRLPFEPGTLKAIGRNDGKEILTKIMKTAGAPAKIELEADRDIIKADGEDLSFISVKVLDNEGTLVPYANNLIRFEISDEGKIIGVDNGLQTSHEPFKANYRKAFNGKCLVVIQSSEKAGKITLETISEGLKSASLEIETK
jgi:beta-galactosidase